VGSVPVATVGVARGVSIPVVALIVYIDKVLLSLLATYANVPAGFTLIEMGLVPVATVGVVRGVSIPVVELIAYMDTVLLISFVT